MSESDTSRRDVLRGIAAGATTAGLAGTASGSDVGSDRGRYNVGLTAGASLDVAREHAGTVHREFDFGSHGTAITGQFSGAAIRQLREAVDLRYVEPDRRGRAVDTEHSPARIDQLADELERSVAETTDTPSSDQTTPWGVERVDADRTLDYAETGDGATIAVLDSGVQLDHESLDVVGGVAYVDDGEECSDCPEPYGDNQGHGTHCAGIAAGLDNGTGVVGVAPDVDLYSVKVLNSDNWGWYSDWASGFEWAADQGHDVASLSASGSSPSSLLKDGVEYAVDKGTLVVCAAANEGCCDSVQYPAAYEAALAVSSTTESDDISWFSSRGPEVELAAPGSDVYSTYIGNSYTYLSGTSMACPHVSGAGAQLLSNGYDSEQARSLLKSAADDIGLDDNEQGAGLLDVGSLPFAPYTDDSWVVTTDHLLDAVDDWRNDEITTTLLIDIINYWQSDEPVA